MKLFKIFAGIMGFVALFFLVSLFFPRTYHIEKSTVIDLPAEQTFNYLNNINNWADWSPWNTDIDSTMKFFVSASKTGKGATRYFHGSMVGSGRFRIIESIPQQKLTYNLYINIAEGYFSLDQVFLFKAEGNKTRLSWIDEGDVGMNPVSRYLLPSRVSNTEKGFEEGLQLIKEKAELYYQQKK